MGIYIGCGVAIGVTVILTCTTTLILLFIIKKKCDQKPKNDEANVDLEPVYEQAFSMTDANPCYQTVPFQENILTHNNSAYAALPK